MKLKQSSSIKKIICLKNEICIVKFFYKVLIQIEIGLINSESRHEIVKTFFQIFGCWQGRIEGRYRYSTINCSPCSVPDPGVEPGYDRLSHWVWNSKILFLVSD